MTLIRGVRYVFIPQRIAITGRLVSTAASPTTANLTWGVVSQALGYRVYQVNGTKSTLLTTLGASATSIGSEPTAW